jgi:hypothetical protein
MQRENKTEKITTGTIELTWDSESRLAIIRFDNETHATGKDAAMLVDALTRLIGRDHKPFGLLGDGGSLAHVDAEYRSIWGKFFRQHRDDSYIAFFNMNPLIRIAAEMFAVGMRLHLEAFADETQARSWLRKRGIAA